MRRALAALAIAVAVPLAGCSQGHAPRAVPCQVTQPVYRGTVQAGTWHGTLQAGQSVTLPDGDTATCTAAGLYVH